MRLLPHNLLRNLALRHLMLALCHNLLLPRADLLRGTGVLLYQRVRRVLCSVQ